MAVPGPEDPHQFYDPRVPRWAGGFLSPVSSSPINLAIADANLLRRIDRVQP